MKNMFWVVRLLSVVIILIISVSCSKDENVKCKERINEECMCITVWEPVCGCNGKTYSNSGCASCAGITDYSEGECK